MKAQDLRQWSTPAQEALVLALHRHRHSQPAASERLAELGTPVTQQWLSQLINHDHMTAAGKERNVGADVAEVLAKYCTEVGVDLLYRGSEVIELDDRFIGEGEPDLGGRRARLVDGVLDRLQSVSGPVTREELELVAWLSKVERMSPPLEVANDDGDRDRAASDESHRRSAEA